jgi:hypothetical protein
MIKRKKYLLFFHSFPKQAKFYFEKVLSYIKKLNRWVFSAKIWKNTDNSGKAPNP